MTGKFPVAPPPLECPIIRKVQIFPSQKKKPFPSPDVAAAIAVASEEKLAEVEAVVEEGVADVGGRGSGRLERECSNLEEKAL